MNKHLILFLFLISSNIFAISKDELKKNILNDNIIKIKKDLVGNVDLNFEFDDIDETPLTLAIRNGNLDLVKFLVSKNANVNYVLKDGNTPLLRSIIENNKNIALYLIEKGADINYSNDDGHTALSLSIRNKNL